MIKGKFSLNFKDETLTALASETEHRTLGMWAADCAERVLPNFQQDFPQDQRPEWALSILRDWTETGQFSMQTIRSAALAAHAAAREVGADTPARSAARAAGQAVSSAHVPAHAIAAANYALQAVHQAHNQEDPDKALANERAWQYQHLLELQDAST